MKRKRLFLAILSLVICFITVRGQSNIPLPKVAQKQEKRLTDEQKPNRTSLPKPKTPTDAYKERNYLPDLQTMSSYELELKASKGDVLAQYILGKRWVKTGDSVSVAKGANWIYAAAKQGLPDAQYAMGILLFRGYGVERNLMVSRQGMQKAAAGGSMKAKKFLNSNKY